MTVPLNPRRDSDRAAEGSYLLDNRAVETGQRFDALGALFNRVTFRHMDDLGIAEGWRCLEVGAGGESVVRWLSERAGPSGWVLATDLEPKWLAGLPLPNVEVRRHDIVADDLPEAAFDLVHARLVLIHIPQRDVALRRMARALRPGGWLLIEDFDPNVAGEACLDPQTDDHHLANKMRAAFRRLLTERGADLEYGRKLPRLLREEGLVDIGADGHLTVMGGEALRRLDEANLLQVRDALLGKGLVTEGELTRYLELLRAPDFELSMSPLVSAWGRRPV